MKGVPAEIDSLMWRLAEEGGPAARAEFESRHVRYAPELARRVAMVNELRQAGRTASPRPTFTPRPVRRVPPPAWAIGAVVGLVAIAVGAVAFVAASRPSGASTAPVVVQTPREPDATEVVTPPQERSLPRPEPMPIEPPQRVVEKPKDAPYETPRDVRIDSTDLAMAIELVAAGGGLKVTVAPGLENRKVSFEYTGLNTIDALQAMGEEFGFSVLEEGEGAVLVVPARPTKDPTRRVGP